MAELNKLFVCSQCGHSIAPQLDNLDIVRGKLTLIIKRLESLVKEVKQLEDKNDSRY